MDGTSSRLNLSPFNSTNCQQHIGTGGSGPPRSGAQIWFRDVDGRRFLNRIAASPHLRWSLKQAILWPPTHIGFEDIVIRTQLALATACPRAAKQKSHIFGSSQDVARSANKNPGCDYQVRPVSCLESKCVDFLEYRRVVPPSPRLDESATP